MKAKLFFAIFIFSIAIHAQQYDCVKNEELFSKFIQEKEYAKAYELLSELKTKCPKYSEKIYLLGNQVLQYNIEISSEEKKEESVRELIKFLDQFDKNFPDNSNGNFQIRALALYDNKVGTEQEILSFLENSFTLQRDNFTNSQLLYTYLKAYYESSKLEKSLISADDLIEKYNSIEFLANENSKKFPEKEAEYKRAISSANSLFSNVLVCTNLIPYAQKNLERNKSNISWLENTANSLSDKCKSAPIFETVSLELHKLNPTSKSAYYLGDFYLNTNKQKQAITYFTESVTLATNKLEKAKTANTIALVLFNSDKAKAKEMIFTAINNDESNGKYYIFLASLYANSTKECAANDAEKKAIYQLASTTVLKAASVDPRLKVSVEKLSNDYLKNVVVDKSFKNKAIKINCWINETVQF